MVPRLAMLTKRCNGVSPSGKAAGFGPAIRGFESSRPSLVLEINGTNTALIAGLGF